MMNYWKEYFTQPQCKKNVLFVYCFSCETYLMINIQLKIIRGSNSGAR